MRTSYSRHPEQELGGKGVTEGGERCGSVRERGGEKRTKWGGIESNVGKKESKVGGRVGGEQHREERELSWGAGGDGDEQRGGGGG